MVLVDLSDGNEVLMGESIWRFPRGEAGRLYGEDIVVLIE